MLKLGGLLYIIVLASTAALTIYSIGIFKFVFGFVIGLLIWRTFNYVINLKENKRIDKEISELETREREHKERVLNAFKR